MVRSGRPEPSHRPKASRGLERLDQNPLVAARFRGVPEPNWVLRIYGADEAVEAITIHVIPHAEVGLEYSGVSVDCRIEFWVTSGSEPDEDYLRGRSTLAA